MWIPDNSYLIIAREKIKFEEQNGVSELGTPFFAVKTTLKKRGLKEPCKGITRSLRLNDAGFHFVQAHMYWLPADKLLSGQLFPVPVYISLWGKQTKRIWRQGMFVMIFCF